MTHTSGTFLIDPLKQKRLYISSVYAEEGMPELSLPLKELLIKDIRKILQRIDLCCCMQSITGIPRERIVWQEQIRLMRTLILPCC